MMTGRFWSGKYPAVLLLLLSAGGASAAPPQPRVAATQSASAQPATPQLSPAVSKDAAPVETTLKPVAPAVAVSPAAPAPTAAPTLDLNALAARLKATKAIDVFTKISLKNKVDDLMQGFAEHHQGKTPPMAELRLSYDRLMMKVLSLLQDEDEALAADVISSREAIWALLADETTFAALQG